MKFGFKPKTTAESTNTLTIKDKKFKITSAVFGATISYYERLMYFADPNSKPIRAPSGLGRDGGDWDNLRWTLSIESQFIDFVEADRGDDPYPNATNMEKLELAENDPAYAAYLVRNADENADVAYDWTPDISADFIILDNMPAPYDLLGVTLKVPGYDHARQTDLFTMYVFEHTSLEKNKIEFVERNGDSFRIKWTGKCSVVWDRKYGRNLDFNLDCWIKFCGILVAADSREEADALVKARLDLSKLPIVEKVEAEEIADIDVTTRAGYRYSI